MDEVKERARRELRAQLRAVTPEDYEDLAKNASRTVARVKCNIPQASNGRLPPGVVEILVIPAVADSLKVSDLSKLYVDDTLTRTIRDHLDTYRLLTTTLQIGEPNYIGIRVHAEIVPSEFSPPDEVRARVIETLNTFLCPLNIADNPDKLDDLMGPEWRGWPFGRSLFVAEIYSLIQRVPGVKHVLDVSLAQTPVIPREELPPDIPGDRPDREEDLVAIKKKVVRLRPNSLLCSLEHDIVLLDLDELMPEDEDER